MPGLGELRALLVGRHPETARCRAGGPPRMLPLRQVLSDWCTERGQRIVDEARTHEGLARSAARRQALALRDGHDRERELVARRARAIEAARALDLQWRRQDEAAALRARRVAA